MNELIKKLAAALGLGEDADEEQILTALSACVEENKALKEAAEGGKTPGKKPGEGGKPEDQDDGIVANKSVCELLGLKAGASTADVAASIMALKGGRRRARQGPRGEARRPRRRGGRGAGPQEREDHPGTERVGQGVRPQEPRRLQGVP